MQNDPAIKDRTANQDGQALSVGGPVMLVNLFTPMPGKAEEFVRVQSAEYVRLRGRVEGYLGNRLGKAVDGSEQLVNVALFDSIESYNKWRASALFADHMDIIRPLIEKAAPGMYAVAYSFGEV